MFISKEVLQIWDHLEVLILIDRAGQMLVLHVYRLMLDTPAQKMSKFINTLHLSFVTIDPSISRADRVIKGTCDTLGTFYPGPAGQGVTK